MKAYGAEGVADACLRLQDDHDQCVPLMLWGVWVTTTGAVLDEEVVEAAVDTARSWSDTTIAPLRAIRRRLKSPISDMDSNVRETFRKRIKADELEAERLLMVALFELAQSLPLKGESSGHEIAKQAIGICVTLSKSWNGVAARAAISSLCEALTKGDFLRYNPQPK